MSVPQVVDVIAMPRVKTPLDRTHAFVLMVTLEMELAAVMSMNVQSTIKTVTPTRNALTLKDHLLASVTIQPTIMATGQPAMVSEALETPPS